MKSKENINIIIDIEETGENIRNLRKTRGISVSDMQSVFGFNNATSIYKWEEGKSILLFEK